MHPLVKHLTETVDVAELTYRRVHFAAALSAGGQKAEKVPVSQEWTKWMSLLVTPGQISHYRNTPLDLLQSMLTLA